MIDGNSFYVINGVETCLDGVEAVRGLKAARCEGVEFMAESELLLSLEERMFRGKYEMSWEEYRWFDANNLNGEENIRAFDLKAEDMRYRVPAKGWFINRQGFSADSSRVALTIGLVIDRFTRGDFPTDVCDDRMYFRYMTPMAGGKLNFRDFAFRCFGYTVGNSWNWSTERLRLRISDVDYDMYVVSKDDASYLCIDNVEALTLRQFSKAVTAVLFGFGFVIQRIVLDEEYLFVLDGREHGMPTAMRYMALRESISGQYCIFTTNAYSVLKPMGKSLATDVSALTEEWSARLTPMSEGVLSTLCQMLYDHDGLINAVTMIVESSRAGLEVQGAVLSVALEAINQIIPAIMEERGSVTSECQHPMDPARWKRLRRQIEKMVKGSDLSEAEQRFFIDKKLNSANQPTNTDTLTAPFSQLGISLADDEEKVAEYRNTFLHGRLPVRNVIGEADSLYLICLKMHHLCSLLLLKLAGFDGYIVDMSQFSSPAPDPQRLFSVFRHI